MLKLIDSSCWIPALRRNGDAAIRERVRLLITSGQAAWCAPVRLELWCGVRHQEERRVLSLYEETLPDLPITPRYGGEAVNSLTVAAAKAKPCEPLMR
jgi:hypothetical protein